TFLLASFAGTRGGLQLLLQILNLHLLRLYFLLQLIHRRLVRRHRLSQHPNSSGASPPPSSSAADDFDGPPEPLPQNPQIPQLPDHRHVSDPHPIRIPGAMRLLQGDVRPLHRRDAVENLVDQHLHLHYSINRNHIRLDMLLVPLPLLFPSPDFPVLPVLQLLYFLLVCLLFLCFFFFILVVCFVLKHILLLAAGSVAHGLIMLNPGERVEQARSSYSLNQVGEIRHLGSHFSFLARYLDVFSVPGGIKHRDNNNKDKVFD
ncbi:hypothetical protein LINGRAHAP2_LOCUS5973, partial [Linum grandiflorum]